MKVKTIWESVRDNNVVYKIDDKCYYYNREYDEMPYLETGQEVSASVLGTPHKVIKTNGLYPELAFTSDMKKVNCIEQRVQANQTAN